MGVPGDVLPSLEPALDPLPVTHSNGLTVVGIRKEPLDTDRLAEILIEMARERVARDKRQAAALRGEVKLLAPPESRPSAA